VAIRCQVNAVTVERIDQSSLRIASHNKSSSAQVKSLALEDKNYDAIEILGDIYRRLSSREAKWLTRLILKDYSPVKFPDSLVCQSNHSFLPRCIQVRAQFTSSIPTALRRDGPGSLRLADNNGIPRPPASLLEPEACLTRKRACGSSPLRPPSVERRRAISSAEKSIVSEKVASPENHKLWKSKLFFQGTGKCRMTEQTCQLINCLFISAPCIASTPWLIENLLPWHGASFVTSLQALLDPSLPRRCPQTGKKYRKIALVETNRPEKTAEFLKSIGRLNLKTSQGKKDWIEVYDWRILECIAKVDQGKQLAYDPWRRCWIGAV
jgi:hypothetical protein